jgi:hypothetical protein
MAKGLPGAASVVFYLLDAYALLREQYFRLGFLLSNRYWKDSLRLKTLPAEFRRAEPLCKGAFYRLGLCLRVAHAQKPMHVALLLL